MKLGKVCNLHFCAVYLDLAGHASAVQQQVSG